VDQTRPARQVRTVITTCNTATSPQVTAPPRSMKPRLDIYRAVARWRSRLAQDNIGPWLRRRAQPNLVRCSNLGLPREVGMPAVFAWQQQVVGHCSHLMGGTGQHGLNNSNLFVFFLYQNPIRLSSTHLVCFNLRS
jgi:hypothetical protein